MCMVQHKVPNTLMADRMFHMWNVWAQLPDETLVLAWTPMSNYSPAAPGDTLEALLDLSPEELLPSPQIVSATSAGAYIITPLAPNVCTFTWVTFVDLRGSVPAPILTRLMHNTMDWPSVLQHNFRRNDYVVDGELRDTFPVPPSYECLDREQTGFVEANAAALQAAPDQIPESSPHALITLTSSPTSPHLTTATATIDCPAHDALAWFVAYDGRERMRHAAESGNLCR